MKHNIYQSIALMGTSADPPTNGHEALLIGLSKIFPTVITWASDNPGKNHKTSLSQRHELLNALVEELALPNLELHQELSHQWAIKTLQSASELWPNKSLTLIIGSDLITDLPNWLDAKNILRKAQLGIVPRIGWPLVKHDIDTLKDIGGKVIILPLKIPATASSAINNNQIFSQIPTSILPILQQKNLYGISGKKI